MIGAEIGDQIFQRYPVVGSRGKLEQLERFAGHLQAVRRDELGLELDVHNRFAALRFTQSYRREGGMSSYTR